MFPQVGPSFKERRKRRIDSLEFVDELHDDIATFLTKAHTEADVLKYLDGQLVYSKPTWLDKDRWALVRNSIYQDSIDREIECMEDLNDERFFWPRVELEDDDHVDHETGESPKNGKSERSRRESRSKKKDANKQANPPSKEEERTLSPSPQKRRTKIFGGPPRSDQIRWPKVLHERVWESLDDLAPLDPLAPLGKGTHFAPGLVPGEEFYQQSSQSLDLGSSLPGISEHPSGCHRSIHTRPSEQHRQQRQVPGINEDHRDKDGVPGKPKISASDDEPNSGDGTDTLKTASDEDGSGDNPITSGSSKCSKESPSDASEFEGSRTANNVKRDQDATDENGAADIEEPFRADSLVAPEGGTQNEALLGTVEDRDFQFEGSHAYPAPDDPNRPTQTGWPGADLNRTTQSAWQAQAVNAAQENVRFDGSHSHADGKQDTACPQQNKHSYTAFKNPTDLLQFTSCFESGNLKYAVFRGVTKIRKKRRVPRMNAMIASDEKTSGEEGGTPDDAANTSSKEQSDTDSKEGKISDTTKSDSENPNDDRYYYSAFIPCYDLVLDHDSNTQGHTQWFYFAVRKMKKNQTVRLRIINNCKASSLFSQGMKPLCWSEQHAKTVLNGKTEQTPGVIPDMLSKLWRGMGENITYGRNGIPGAFTKMTKKGGHSNHNQSTSSLPANNADNEEKTGGAEQSIARLQSIPSDAKEASQAWHKESKMSYYYTLSIDITFEYNNDTVFLAYTYPYTYTMLRNLLYTIEYKYPEKGQFVRRKTLCQTLGRADCDILSVSNWDVAREDKKYVVVSSRVHPGEANASWLMHGFLNFILSNSPEAIVLRNHFIFKIVPMLNPDGVICGNYRCSLAGVDLNRQWRYPDPVLDQSVYELKKLMAKLKKSCIDLVLYLDLHGHSRKTNLFAYGCSPYQPTDHRFFTVRMYPKILSILAPEFSYRCCRFGGGGAGKRGTGRIVVAKDIGLTESFTIEASFYGAVVDEDGQNAANEAMDTQDNKLGDVTQEEPEENDSEEEGAKDDGNLNETTTIGHDALVKTEDGKADQQKENTGLKETKIDQKDHKSDQIEKPTRRLRIVPFTSLKLETLGAELARGLLIHFHLAQEVEVVQKDPTVCRSVFKSMRSKAHQRTSQTKKYAKCLAQSEETQQLLEMEGAGKLEGDFNAPMMQGRYQSDNLAEEDASNAVLRAHGNGGKSLQKSASADALPDATIDDVDVDTMMPSSTSTGLTNSTSNIANAYANLGKAGSSPEKGTVANNIALQYSVNAPNSIGQVSKGAPKRFTSKKKKKNNKARSKGSKSSAQDDDPDAEPSDHKSEENAEHVPNLLTQQSTNEPVSDNSDDVDEDEDEIAPPPLTQAVTAPHASAVTTADDRSASKNAERNDRSQTLERSQTFERSPSKSGNSRNRSLSRTKKTRDIAKLAEIGFSLEDDAADDVLLFDTHFNQPECQSTNPKSHAKNNHPALKPLWVPAKNPVTKAINLDQLLQEIQMDDLVSRKKQNELTDDAYISGSDSNPSGDNLSPDKLSNVRQKLGSRSNEQATSSPDKKRKPGLPARKRKSEGHPGGHFHGIMRRYLNCRNLFSTNDTAQVKNQKLSLLEKIVAFGRTTYVSKNSKLAGKWDGAGNSSNNGPTTSSTGTGVSNLASRKDCDKGEAESLIFRPQDIEEEEEEDVIHEDADAEKEVVTSEEGEKTAEDDQVGVLQPGVHKQGSTSLGMLSPRNGNGNIPAAGTNTSSASHGGSVFEPQPITTTAFGSSTTVLASSANPSSAANAATQASGSTDEDRDDGGRIANLTIAGQRHPALSSSSPTSRRTTEQKIMDQFGSQEPLGHLAQVLLMRKEFSQGPKWNLPLAQSAQAESASPNEKARPSHAASGDILNTSSNMVGGRGANGNVPVGSLNETKGQFIMSGSNPIALHGNGDPSGKANMGATSSAWNTAGNPVKRTQPQWTNQKYLVQHWERQNQLAQITAENNKSASPVKRKGGRRKRKQWVSPIQRRAMEFLRAKKKQAAADVSSNDSKKGSAGRADGTLDITKDGLGDDFLSSSLKEAITSALAAGEEDENQIIQALELNSSGEDMSGDDQTGPEDGDIPLGSLMSLPEGNNIDAPQVSVQQNFQRERANHKNQTVTGPGNQTMGLPTVTPDAPAPDVIKKKTDLIERITSKVNAEPTKPLSPPPTRLPTKEAYYAPIVKERSNNSAATVYSGDAIPDNAANIDHSSTGDSQGLGPNGDILSLTASSAAEMASATELLKMPAAESKLNPRAVGSNWRKETKAKQVEVTAHSPWKLQNDGPASVKNKNPFVENFLLKHKKRPGANSFSSQSLEKNQNQNYNYALSNSMQSQTQNDNQNTSQNAVSYSQNANTNGCMHPSSSEKIPGMTGPLNEKGTKVMHLRDPTAGLQLDASGKTVPTAVNFHHLPALPSRPLPTNHRSENNSYREDPSPSNHPMQNTGGFKAFQQIGIENSGHNSGRNVITRESPSNTGSVADKNGWQGIMENDLAEQHNSSNSNSVNENADELRLTKRALSVSPGKASLTANSMKPSELVRISHAERLTPSLAKARNISEETAIMISGVVPAGQEETRREVEEDLLPSSSSQELDALMISKTTGHPVVGPFANDKSVVASLPFQCRSRPVVENSGLGSPDNGGADNTRDCEGYALKFAVNGLGLKGESSPTSNKSPLNRVSKVESAFNLNRDHSARPNTVSTSFAQKLSEMETAGDSLISTMESANGGPLSGTNSSSDTKTAPQKHDWCLENVSHGTLPTAQNIMSATAHASFGSFKANHERFDPMSSTFTSPPKSLGRKNMSIDRSNGIANNGGNIVDPNSVGAGNIIGSNVVGGSTGLGSSLGAGGTNTSNALFSPSKIATGFSFQQSFSSADLADSIVNAITGDGPSVSEDYSSFANLSLPHTSSGGRKSNGLSSSVTNTTNVSGNAYSPPNPSNYITGKNMLVTAGSPPARMVEHGGLRSSAIGQNPGKVNPNPVNSNTWQTQSLARSLASQIARKKDERAMTRRIHSNTIISPTKLQFQSKVAQGR